MRKKKLFICDYPNGHWIYVRAHNKKQALKAARCYVDNRFRVSFRVSEIEIKELDYEPERYSVKGDYIYPWQVLIEVD